MKRNLACNLYYFSYFIKYLLIYLKEKVTARKEREREKHFHKKLCLMVCPVGRTMERGVSCQWRDHLGNSDFVHEEDR